MEKSEWKVGRTYNILNQIRLELFSFAVPSTAKEIIFHSAALASQAQRAVKQYKKIRNRTQVLHTLNLVQMGLNRKGQ